MIRNSYIPAIDGLRAIAVLAVLVYHLNARFLPGGFVGVDIFFVISGYVVTRSLAGRTGEGFGSFLAGFYARRIRRIIPALTVCLLVTVLFTVLFVPQAWLSQTMSQVALSAFFGVSNFALVFYQDGYFSPRSEFNPFVHTWSLAVEEQFYFVFPVLIYFWFKAINNQGADKHKSSVWPWPTLLMPLLALLSLAFAAYAAKAHPDWGFYMLPARFWELAVGVMLFQWQQKGWMPALSDRLSAVVAASGLGLIALSVFTADANAFPYPWALAPVSGTFLLLWAVTGSAHGATPLLARLLSTRVMVYVGLISYSLYLWHWPVFTLMRWTTGLQTTLTMAVAVLLSLVMASASYTFIEKPTRHWHWLAASRAKAISAGLLLMGGAWAMSAGMFLNRDAVSLSVTANERLWYPYAHREPQVDDVNDQALAGRQIFVIGNSHTGAYATMLHLLEQRQGIKAHLMQVGQCAVGNLSYPINAFEGCQALVADRLKAIEAMAKPGDIVMFASLRASRLSDQWYRNDPQAVLQKATSQEGLDAVAAAEAEIVPILQSLQAQGIKVLIDAPKPVLRGPPYRCSDWFNQHNPICEGGFDVPRDYLEQSRQPVMDAMQRLAGDFPNVYLWDPLPILCPHDVCTAFDKAGLPLFFDGDHLSGHGNRVLYPSFENRVLSLYP